MLIFVKGHYLPLIASGRKTTTIRPWKTCKLGLGDELVFNSKIRCLVTRVEQRRLHEVTADDALADGFDTRAAFLQVFHEYYPAAPTDAPICIIHFVSPSQ
jgi:hypothetical protein